MPPPLPGDGGMADRQRSTGNSQFLINGFSDKINFYYQVISEKKKLKGGIHDGYSVFVMASGDKECDRRSI